MDVVIRVSFEDGKNDIISQVISNNNNYNDVSVYNINYFDDDRGEGYFISEDSSSDVNPLNFFEGDDYIIFYLDLPLGEYTVNTVSDNDVYASRLDVISVIDEDSDVMNTFDITLSVCNDVLLDKSCKYFHHEPYMTPNNFDLYFDYLSIPVNNILESPLELRKRLQNKLPVTKILHLNLEKESVPENNSVFLQTGCSLVYDSLKDNLDTILVVTGSWNVNILNEVLVQDRVEVIYEWYDDLFDFLNGFNFTNLYTLIDEDKSILINDIINLLNQYNNFDEIKDKLVFKFSLFLLSLLSSIPEEEFSVLTPNNIENYNDFKDYVIKTKIYDYENEDGTSIIDTIFNMSINDYMDEVPVSIIHVDKIIDNTTPGDYVYTNGDISFNTSDLSEFIFSYDEGILNITYYMYSYDEGILNFKNNITNRGSLSEENNYQYNSPPLPIFENVNGYIDINRPIHYKSEIEKRYIYKCEKCGHYYMSNPEECVNGCDDIISPISIFSAVIEDYDNSPTINKSFILL